MPTSIFWDGKPSPNNKILSRFDPENSSFGQATLFQKLLDQGHTFTLDFQAWDVTAKNIFQVVRDIDATIEYEISGVRNQRPMPLFFYAETFTSVTEYSPFLIDDPGGLDLKLIFDGTPTGLARFDDLQGRPSLFFSLSEYNQLKAKLPRSNTMFLKVAGSSRVAVDVPLDRFFIGVGENPTFLDAIKADMEYRAYRFFREVYQFPAERARLNTFLPDNRFTILKSALNEYVATEPSEIKKFWAAHLNESVSFEDLAKFTAKFAEPEIQRLIWLSRMMYQTLDAREVLQNQQGDSAATKKRLAALFEIYKRFESDLTAATQEWFTVK